MALLNGTHNVDTKSDWDDQSELGLSWSDTDSYTDDDDDDDVEDSEDELNMPLAGKRSREMTLGGLVFNSSQFTANQALEQSLNKLLTNQGVLKLATDALPEDNVEVKRTKSPESTEPTPLVKDLIISAPSLASVDIKRVTSTTALEALKAKVDADAASLYQYDTEMNVEDIMAMRNLTRSHGRQAFTKSKSLSAPDLTAPSFLAGSKQMDELEEESESSEADSEDDDEDETIIPKAHRHKVSDFSKTSPDDFLQSTVRETFGICPEKVQSSSVLDFFLQITPDMISSYDMEVATAVRNEDLRTLSRMHRRGKTLQCCNRFGESIVHTVCRRGSIKLLQFLMEQAQISLKVKCDYGRTPLHDACWTRDPNFELIAIVLEQCPDFLWMTDKRGFTPLNYVQRDQWGLWCVFLDEHKLLLKPKVIS